MDVPAKAKDTKPSKLDQLRKKSFREIKKDIGEFQAKKPKAPEVKPEVKEEVKNLPAEKIEEKKEDAPKEEVKPEVKEIPVVDEEKLADKSADKVIEKLQKIEEDKKTNEEEKAKKLESLKLKWEREGKEKPDSWKDIVDEAKRLAKEETLDEAKRYYDEREAEKENKRVDEEGKKKAELDKSESIRNNLMAELQDLERLGKIPKIKNPNDPNDRGVKFQNALLQRQFEVNQERIKKGELPIESPKLIFYEHFESPEEQPAGGDAPIAGASPAAPQTFKPTVQQIRKMSFSEMAKQVAKNKKKRA